MTNQAWHQEAHLEAIARHNYHVDIRGVYPTLIHGQVAVQCESVENAIVLAYKMIKHDEELADAQYEGKVK